MSVEDRPAWVQAEYERIGRERMQAGRDIERHYRWELLRVCAEMIGWTAAGTVIAGFGFHVSDSDIGWILFHAGMVVNWAGVLWALGAAYVRGEKRGRLVVETSATSETIRKVYLRLTPSPELVMVGLSALWMPVLVSAVFVFIALALIHGMLGWHKGDMSAVPGEAKVMETLRALNLQPGNYRFPFSTSVDEMKTPAWDAKMKQGPVGMMSISPSAPINMGKMFGQWFVYSLFIATLAAYITGRTHGLGASFLSVFRVSAAVALCCYVVALWNNWIWWGQSTRFTVTYTLDGVIYALITGATFGWLWPR